MSGHPTKAIVRFAARAPGGVIRWREARDIYLRESEAARWDEDRAKRLAKRLGRHISGHRQYHMGLQRVLERHFTKVCGTDGFWVLTRSIG